MTRTTTGTQHALALSAPAAPQVDPAEFTRVFSSEAKLVWRVLRRLGVPEADLEDVCQDVFVVVYRRWFEFRGESSLRTWIYGIAVRSAIGHRRRKHVSAEVELGEGHQPIVMPEQGAALDRARSRQALQAALDSLGEGKREVFVLYEIEELPMREVAELLDTPMHTCYSRLYTARAELATRLRRAGRKGVGA